MAGDTADGHDTHHSQTRPRVMLLTSSFPFGFGESFLADEIDAVSRSADVFVVPLHPRGPRQVALCGGAGGVTVLSERLLGAQVVRCFARTVFGRPSAVARALVDSARDGRNWWRSLAGMPKALWIAAEAQRLEVSHIHAYWASTPATAAMIASDACGLPWSFTAHRWDIYGGGNIVLKASRASFARFISERGLADAIAFGVEADPKRAFVLHLGVKTGGVDQSPAAHGEREFTIACPANFIAVKGHDVLLRAIGAVRVQSGCHLRLFGTGPTSVAMRRLALQLGIEDRVSFEGHVDRPTLLRMYDAGEIDVVVLASRELPGHEHEGVPISLVEAMIRGIPVVSTATGSIPELLLPESALVVGDGDSQAMADVLVRLATDATFSAASSEYCRMRVAQGWSAADSAQVLLGRFGDDGR